MIKRIPIAILVCTCLLAHAEACESLRQLDAGTARKMMGVIRQVDGDVLDQMEAFKILSCSDEPALRNFAIEDGLRAKSPIVRSLALAEQIFQREQIRIDFLPDASIGDREKIWMEQQGRALVYKIEIVNRQSSCVSISARSKCDDPRNEQRLTIDRDKVRLMDRDIQATFSLQPDGSLRGMLKPGRILKDIPARILLQ